MAAPYHDPCPLLAGMLTGSPTGDLVVTSLVAATAAYVVARLAGRESPASWAVVLGTLTVANDVTRNPGCYVGSPS